MLGVRRSLYLMPAVSGRSSQCLSLLELEAIEDPANPEAGHLENCAYCRGKLARVRKYEARALPDTGIGAGQTPQCLPLLVLEDLAENPLNFPKASMARQHLELCVWCSSKVSMLRTFESRPLPRILHHGRIALIAASLVAAVGLGLWTQRRPQAASGGPEIYRSARLLAISPAGLVSDAPRDFMWKPVENAVAYRLHLMDVDRSEIWSLETKSSTLPIPDEVRQKMTAGTAFLWKVEARNSAGEKIAETNLQKFYVSIVKRPVPGPVE